MAAVDRIELIGLRVMGTHGLLPEELGRAQPFEVDVLVGCDLAPAGDSDDVNDTINYAAIVDAAVAVVTGPRRDLLETLAGEIARNVLLFDAVTSVEVAIRKLRPPVPADLATAGVRIVRSR